MHHIYYCSAFETDAVIQRPLSRFELAIVKSHVKFATDTPPSRTNNDSLSFTII